MQKHHSLRFRWNALVAMATLAWTPLAFATPTVSPVTANSNNISRYDVYEVTMTATSSGYTYPQDGVNITAVFTAPSSATYTVHGFFYDVNTWKLRFAPMETGTWTYTLSFDDGTTPVSLTTSGGNSFSCVASTNTGFLRINQTNKQRFFTDGDNKAFYVLGFDKTNAGGMAGALAGGLGDGVNYPSLLDNMKIHRSAGFNFIRDNSQGASYYTTINASQTGKNLYDIAAGQLGDTYIQAYRQGGMKVQMGFWLKPPSNIYNNSTSSWDTTTTGNIAAIQNYHRYIISRFGAYVDIWELCNESSGMTQAYLDTVEQVCTNYPDPYHHPTTVSYAQGQIDESAMTVYAGNHNYLTTTNLGVAGSWGGSFNTWHNTYPNKPLVFGEAGNASPVGKYDPERFRVGIWSAFANAAAMCWWQVTFDRNNCEFGASLTNMYLGREERMLAKILSNFTSDFDPLATQTTVTITPSNQVAAAYSAGGATSNLILASNQDIFAYFTHSTNHYTTVHGATVQLSIPANGMQGVWVDPATGNIVSTFTASAGTQSLTIPDFKCDIALRIRAASANPKLGFSTGVYSVHENQSTVTITVNRSGPSTGAVSVDYSTSDGLAVAGRNYLPATGTLSWANNDSAPKSFTVTLLNNNIYNGDKDIRLTLSNPTGGATLDNNDNALISFINDKASQLILDANQYTGLKTDGSIVVTVNRIGNCAGPIQAIYDVTASNAIAAIPSTPLVWADGDLAPKTIVLPVLNNGTGYSSSTIEIVGEHGCSFGMPYRANIKIAPDATSGAGILIFKNPSLLTNMIGAIGYIDAGYAVTRPTSGSTTVNVPVSRVGGSTGAISVAYTLVGGTAVAGTDYTNVSGTLTWADGDTADKNIPVPVLASVTTGNVVIWATLGTTTGGALVNGRTANRAAVYITDPNTPPVLTSLPFTSGTVGGALTYQITATNTPTSYSATGLPSGLSINTATGAITGTPNAGTQGSYDVTMGATNAAGTSTADLMLTILPSSGSPTIVTQPSSISVVAGQSITFTVAASGPGNLTYQWKLGGVSIPGAIGSSYTLSSPALSDNGGQYTVEIRTNGINPVTSNVAILTVTSSAVAPTYTALPSTLTVNAGASVLFSVAANGTASQSVAFLPASLSYQWLRNGTAINGATSSSYMISPATAADNGAAFSVTITNSAGSVTTNTETLTVTGGTGSPVISSISVTPLSASLQTSTTQQFSAVAKDQYGNLVSPQPTLTWTVNSGGGSINSSGLYTAGSTAGPFTISATDSVSGVVGHAGVTVTLPPPVLTSIAITPFSVSMAIGGTKQFTAVAKDQYGNPLSIQPSFTWNASGGGLIDTNGLYTAGNVAGGPFSVTASSGTVTSAAAGVLITASSAPILTSILVTPTSAGIPVGTTQQFTAVAKDQYGVNMSPQPSFIWSAAGTNSINTSTGLFTAGNVAGNYTVSASSGGTTGAANATVTVPLVLFDDALRNGYTFNSNAALVTTPVHSGTSAYGGTTNSFATIGLSGTKLLTSGSTNTWVKTYVYIANSSVGVASFKVSLQVGTSSFPTVTFNNANSNLWYADGAAGHVNLTSNTWHEVWFNLPTAFGSTIVPGTGTTKLTGVVAQVNVNASGSETIYMDDTILTTPMPTLTSVAVIPAIASVTTTTSRQYAAIAQDQYGFDLLSQPSFAWTLLNDPGTGSSIGASTGAFTAGATAGGPFSVQATTSSISGTASVSVVNPPSPPAGPTGVAAVWMGNQVLVSWTAVNGATSYSVLRGTSSNGPFTAIQTNATSTSYTDTTAVSGTTYYYEVTWDGGSGGSLPSSPVATATSGPMAESTDTPTMPGWALVVLAALLMATMAKSVPGARARLP